MLFKSVKVDVDNVDFRTKIYITGQTLKNSTVMIRVADFKPYMYIELPTDSAIDWRLGSNVRLIKNAIFNLMAVSKKGKVWNVKPCGVKLEWRKKTFYAHVVEKDGNMVEKLFPFLKVSYKSDILIKIALKTIEQTRSMDGKIAFNAQGLGKIDVKLHETNVDPQIQLYSLMKLNHGGWNSFSEKSAGVIKIAESSKISRCSKEFIVPYKALSPSDEDLVVNPKCMSFDIECNSWRISAMPDAEHDKDCIFQISAVIFRMTETDESKWEKILLTLGNPEIDEKENITCRSFESERELIVGFKDLILEKDPLVMIGYNILTFDIPYIISRAERKYCISEFQELGNRLGAKSEERIIKWKSSAYGEQKMKFIDSHGRIFLDLLPVVKRNYKLSTYSLKTVSNKFLGVSKDPLTPQGIFKCYRMGMKDDKRGRRALGICGKYCVMDSVLVARLSTIFQVWIDACETAKTCNIPISYLYTKGQQVRFFALMVKQATHENYVVEKDAYVRKDSENYSGATVIKPTPGLYHDVVPFDFASLYPTVMISNNISTETLVNDDIPNTIKDEDCNICEWEDHIGCSHDNEERKTAVKNVICTPHRYRFLKSDRIKGIVARILESLLHERALEKKVLKERKAMLKRLQTEKDLKEIDGYTAKEMAIMVVVSDKRQAALKIVCNSVYGAMGAQKGFLPCLPCAMCTTAWGRKSLLKAKNIMDKKYNGEICYGDTDSVMIRFKDIKSEDLWDHCMKIDKLLETEFPSPMKLEFEEKIYRKFLIFSKKRYIAHVVEEDYNTLKNVQMKGVMLARRDNSKFARSVYKDCIDMVFNEKTEEEIFMYFHQRAMQLFTRKNPDISDFVITKTVNDISSYKIDGLPADDPLERTRKLIAKKCETERDFGERSLPAHVYLAIKMGKRGKPVEPGSRLEFVMTDRGEYNGALWEKIEDPKYMTEYSDILKICPYYYLSKCVNPVDQLFEVCFGTQHSILRAYKTHVQKHKICKQLRMNSPRLNIVGKK